MIHFIKFNYAIIFKHINYNQLDYDNASSSYLDDNHLSLYLPGNKISIYLSKKIINTKINRFFIADNNGYCSNDNYYQIMYNKNLTIYCIPKCDNNYTIEYLNKQIITDTVCMNNNCVVIEKDKNNINSNISDIIPNQLILEFINNDVNLTSVKLRFVSFSIDYWKF